MNKTKALSITMAATLLISSCSSYNQFSAGVTGAHIGGEVGRTIGFLTSTRGYSGRSQALGSLIGMGVGAAMGVGIATSIENKANRQYQENYDTPPYYDAKPNQSYSNNYNDFQTSGGANSNTASLSRNNSNDFLVMSEPVYYDADGDGIMSKGETCQVETYITNRSSKVLSDIVITIDTDQDTRVTTSSPLITTLVPGQRVHYTGRIYCKKTRKHQNMQVQLNISHDNASLASNILIIPFK